MKTQQLELLNLIDMEYNIEEFNSLVEQLKTIHKPLGLRSIGCFNWEFIERPTGRNKKTLGITYNSENKYKLNMHKMICKFDILNFIRIF